MLRLHLAPSATHDLELFPGVVLEVRRADTSLVNEALIAIADETAGTIADERDADPETVLEDAESADDVTGYRWRERVARALAHKAIIRFKEGIVGEDDKEVAVTPEAIDAFLNEFPAYKAWEILYVTPALTYISEGNA